METTAPFGFVTACYIEDKFHVKATLASMKHYCPDVPICLIVDGTFDVTDLVEQYGVTVLRIPDLPSKKMRNLIAGSYRVKLAAMWEGPFDFYVWMDSDAIVWGDIRPFIQKDVDFQIFWKEVTQPISSDSFDGFKHFYFDYDKLKQFDPSFQWQGEKYFCAGVYACRKNAISFDEWAEVESWGVSEPDLFRFGDQGILNYLVNAKAQRHELRIASDDLQHVWGHHGTEELEADCIEGGWQWPENVLRPRVAHFCGRKPNVLDSRSYSRPFTIARLEHYKAIHSNFEAWLRILAEDFKVFWKKGLRRFERYLQRAVS